MSKFQIYTDGSCLGNPGPGGWGYLITNGNKEWSDSGPVPNTTNNRMEMQAMIEALKKVKTLARTGEFRLHSDSRLLINTITKGWKKKSNTDLWAELDQALADLEAKNWKFNWKWVKGHAGHTENEIVDRLAQNAALKGGRGLKKTAAQKEPMQMTIGLSDNNELRSQIEETLFDCKQCGSQTKGVLSRKSEDGPIRVDCADCGKYIKFAKQV